MPPDADNTLPIARVRAMVDLAVRRGWDVNAFLAEAGIPPILLTEERSRVTWNQGAELVRRLWVATDDELLGLGLQPVPRGTFRLVCFGLISAPTLGASIRRFESFERSLPGFPGIVLTTDADEARLAFDISGIAHPIGILIDTMLAITQRFLGWMIGGRIRLRRVELSYPRNPEIDDYDVVFGVPVTFSAARPTLIFDLAQLDAPIVRTEDDLIDFLRDAPAGVLGTRSYSVSLAAQVRRILERGLTGEWPGVDDIARELLMSPQTLRRRLQEEHTTPREIREEILRDAAIAGLVRGDETVAALSRRLGFSEPSAFSRAFRRWTGSPPGSYQPGRAAAD
ncbi:AraC family transcriptional regulator [Nocardia sp. NBC_01327]|uniref:AraC family transcriptional regulator n=1 Tax=Nocardia sp. NBC_01327 TaxID=2903593 RepID=UPI002E0E2902|nr:AraC family transcriptional regulator [Nocardia sp. NBC_01327]